MINVIMVFSCAVASLALIWFYSWNSRETKDTDIKKEVPRIVELRARRNELMNALYGTDERLLRRESDVFPGGMSCARRKFRDEIKELEDEIEYIEWREREDLRY